MIWMQSLEGKAFDVLNPTPDLINWHTATIALARVHRFGGHTLHGPYSVAQHLVEGTRAVLRDTGRRDWAAAFLLHDFHEAYIGDIMTPVAKAIEVLALSAGYINGDLAVKAALKELKRRIDLAVYEKAGVPYPTGATAGVVKEYDARMAVTERAARLAPYPEPWHHTIESRKPIDGCDLTPWNEHLATSLLQTAMKEILPSLRSDIEVPHEEGCGCGSGWQGWPDTPPPYSIGQDYFVKEKEDVWR